MFRSKKRVRHDRESLLVHILMIVLSLCCLLPFILLVSVSLSNERDLVYYGYEMIPRQLDFAAYEYVLRDPTSIINAYAFTAFTSIAGTAISVVLMSLMAYPLSVKNYRLRRFWAIYLFITMIFSGGLAASYIVNVIYLGIKDTVWVFLLPGAVNVFHVILLRTFFQGLPDEMMDAAKIDGATHMDIFVRIVVPLSKPALATVALFGMLTRWNDWLTCNLYVTEGKTMVTLQYLLQTILKDIEVMLRMQEFGLSVDTSQLPSESARMAMAVLAAGPMIIVFPFFQKYFAKGLTVGSVKG